MNQMSASRCLFVGLLVMVAGCSSRESRVTGRWVEDGHRDASQYIEFFSDKTVRIITSDMPCSGTWAVLDDGRIKADVTALFVKLIVLAELKGGTLIVDMDGKQTTFVQATKEDYAAAKTVADQKQLEAQVKTTRTVIATLSTAADIFELRTGKYPPSMTALFEADPKTGKAPTVAKSDAVDAWGKPLVYELRDERPRITSDGPDKTPGTADDIAGE